MNDREDVCSKLQIVHTWATMGAIDVRDCAKIAQWMADALAMLKEQEARVMTSAEMEEAESGTVVWCEQRDSIRSYMTPMIKYDDGIFENRFLGVHPIAAESSDYIRFWTARPTEAQREATPWET